MACVAVSSLVRTIELEFLQPLPRPIVQEKELILCNKELIQSLHQKLGFLIELFDENRMDGIQAIKDLETKLRDVAFRVEDEIEFQIAKLYEEEEEEEFVMPQRIIVAEETLGDIEAEEEFGIADIHVEKPQRDTDAKKTSPTLKLCHILQQAIEDIDTIKEELVKVKMEYKHVVALQGRKTTLDVFPKSDEVIMTGDSSRHVSHSEDIMVGKNKEFKTVKVMLIEHPSKQREVVSIKGMGGIGKTTLARQVYKDPSIASYFDKRAWVVASQHHNKREMLIGLLKSMGKPETGSDEQLELRLYQCLKGQRYMVVMDDLWSKEAWDAVKTCFPDDRNGSRVLLTTRLVEVENYIGSNNDFSHQMQLLDQSESWNLFREKALKSHNAEFEAIGRPIVEKCKGLPLAIVVVAGLFSKLGTLDEWTNIAKDLNSSATTTIDEECSRMLSSSYNHLPYNLKACFLYLGIFPEDKEIYVKHLVKLWASEGLVKAFENMSFDAVAKRHIQEFKDRNLILVSRRSSCGRKIKAFRMHDLLHSFCVREAKKENLLHVVYENESNSPPKGFRWVSIQSKNFNKDTLYSSLKNCRSIFYFSTVIRSLNLNFCNLLRVIYIVECKIANLVHLRCLFSYASYFNILKPFRAWNLQTLSIGRVDEMNFLEFPQLQHFSCYTTPSDFPILFHQNLRSISWLEPYQCTKELFTNNIPYLKKVKIRCEGAWNDCINNLAYLHQLQNLRLGGNYWPTGGPFVIPNNNHIVCLKNLKKLTFYFMSFEWKAINILCELPGLEVLKLLHSACIGEEWKLPEKENFGELIYLGIGTSSLKRWEAGACHFPKLERLLLYRCYKLEEIPTDFAEISMLKSIKLKHCLPSVVASAKQIQHEQHDQGNNNIVVIEEDTIQPYYSSEIESDEDAKPNSNKGKRGQFEILSLSGSYLLSNGKAPKCSQSCSGNIGELSMCWLKGKE